VWAGWGSEAPDGSPGEANGGGGRRCSLTGGEETTRTGGLYEHYKGVFENKRIVTNYRDPN
jgi:hypothetical protein